MHDLAGFMQKDRILVKIGREKRDADDIALFDVI